MHSRTSGFELRTVNATSAPDAYTVPPPPKADEITQFNVFGVSPTLTQLMNVTSETMEFLLRMKVSAVADAGPDAVLLIGQAENPIGPSL